MNQPQLFAGTAVTDITPPLEVGLLTSSVKGLYEPFESVRLPLKARVLVLKSPIESVAIVSLDLLSLTDTAVGGWENFKRGLAGAISADRIVLCYTHTHSAPESGAITGLYLTRAFKDWLAEISLKISSAIEMANSNVKACNPSIACAILEGYSLQRRIKTPEGIVMSDSLQPIAPELMNAQPVDHRVKSLHLNDGHKQAIATVVHAICHPVHEMCLPDVSAEFPGEMCKALEQSSKNGMAMFFNGAAGDTNPPTVSMGPEYAHAHGAALAGIAQKQENLDFLTPSLAFISTSIPLQIRPAANVTNKFDAVARLSVVKIGELAILFLPGEPFVEAALTIEKSSPFKHTIVVGFSENNVGYIPTLAAFAEGGYEIGPGKWSFAGTETDQLIRSKAIALLEEIHHK